MTYRIIMPMAGFGTRFSEKGFQDPKPLIPVKGYPMFIHVLYNMVDNWNSKQFGMPTVHIGVRQDFYEKYHDILHTISNKFPWEIQFILLLPTQGQADTVDKIIDSMMFNCFTDDPIIIRNCDDVLLDNMWADNAIRLWSKSGCSGGITVFPNTDPKWSYSAIADGRILYTAEKRVISNFATFGCYYFKSMKIASDAIKKMKDRGDTYKNEFYISQAFNYIDGDVLPYFVNNVQGIGTPEDLEMYLAI